VLVDYCLAGDDGGAAIWQREPELDLDGDGKWDLRLTDNGRDGLADGATPV